MVYPLEFKGTSGLGCFQVCVAIVYGVALTLRDRYISGVAEWLGRTLVLCGGYAIISIEYLLLLD